ncbi:MAG: DUF2231 domain-containing protein [Acidimicrobiales bacterium]
MRRLVERIEGDERWDVVTRPVGAVAERLGRTGAAPVLGGDWMGHALHPLMTDLPIGCWTSATVLDLLGGRSSRTAATRLVGLGLLTVPLVAATGSVEYGGIREQSTRRVGAAHAVGNSVATLLFFWSWRDRRRGKHLRGVALGLLGGTVASVTGHLGGHLSFARGVGIGSRGGMDDVPMRPASDLIGFDEASDLLQVPVEQVGTMFAEGMLTDVGDGRGPKLSRAEVLALRNLGG